MDDTSRPEGIQELWNEVEVPRNDTYVRALTEGERITVVGNAGFPIVVAGVVREPQAFENWPSSVNAGGKGRCGHATVDIGLAEVGQRRFGSGNRGSRVVWHHER